MDQKALQNVQLMKLNSQLQRANLHASYMAAQEQKAQAAAIKATQEKESAGKQLIHFKYLSKYVPNLNSADLDRINIADLRQLYYKAYRQQGMTMGDAHAAADKIQP